MLLSLLLAAAPFPSLTSVDARGCGELRVDGAPVEGGPKGLCVTQVLWTPLEGGLVAALVLAPHRFEARVRPRVFLYRLEGGRLWPRFLGSGFSTVEVERLVARADGRLGLEVRGAEGPSRLACAFRRFPLVCSEAP